MAEDGRWNHNIHYHRVILDAVPAGADRALDVGCGEGTLARALKAPVPNVTGIDLDEASIEQARAHPDSEGIEFVVGDALTYPFPFDTFDVVTAVASVHHMDASEALRRLRDLVAPGGVLAIVGLARSSQLADFPYEIAAPIATRLHQRRKGLWDHPSPIVWPPPETYAAMRRLTARLLPGANFRRHVLWRYSIVWRKPA
jgi:2-polyprenyl-3-methyl-5-hydroxy-6-metoxy-1,4-benzoquinol methylase